LYKNKVVAVVIPAYNEEKLIGRVISTMPPYVDFIIVVDDASKDKTCQVVEEFQESIPKKIILIKHKINSGVGGSIADGYLWCRDNEIDVAAVMAGDAQMDPADLERLLDPVVEDKADYSKGNRLFTGDAWNQIPKIRYIGNSLLSLMTKIASGYWSIADSQCGYTVINRKAMKIINWNHMYTRYGQPNDLLVRLNINNLRVVDVPVRPVYNIGEKSGIVPILIIPKMLGLLIWLFNFRLVQKYLIRDFHPLLLFYAIGLPQLFIFSPILLVRLTYMWIISGRIPPINALALMFMIISGLQFVMFAMWFDMQHNNNINYSLYNYPDEYSD
jgi:glycosyltransferase involved in cell wall biosynthesis